MLSRRSVLVVGGVGIAAAGGALVATDRLDDTLAAAGVKPRPAVDQRDVDRLAVARSELQALLDLGESEQQPTDLLAVVREQIDGLPPAESQSAQVSGPFTSACQALADKRTLDVRQALSIDVVIVCASIAAGLTQLGEASA